jgi:microcystin-dependent protein
MDEFIGAIAIFAGNVIPKGWYPCDGRLLDISKNQALASLLGKAYGGDGKTTFGLPDLRGRAILGSGPANAAGSKAGTETVILTPSQVPPHQHSLAVSSQVGTATTVVGSVIAATATTPNLPTAPNIYSDMGTGSIAALGPQSIGPSGNSGPHNNMQPYLALNICICAVGHYPSRP